MGIVNEGAHDTPAPKAPGKIAILRSPKREFLKDTMEFTLSRCSRFPAPKAPGKIYDFEVPKRQNP